MTAQEAREELYNHARAYNEGAYTCAKHYSRANKVSSYFGNKVKILADAIKGEYNDYFSFPNKNALDGLEVLKHAISCGETNDVLIGIIEKIKREL